MDKPLGKYTLEEIKQQCYYCHHPEDKGGDFNMCEKCIFNSACCHLPESWDLGTKYKVTNNEMRIITAFKKLGASEVNCVAGDRFVYFDDTELNFGRVRIDRMPSINTGRYGIDQFRV